MGKTKGMKREEVDKKTEGDGKLKKRESNQIKPVRLNPLVLSKVQTELKKKK